MEIPYSMARRLPPCHCPEEDRDIVQPLRPYLPLMLSLRDPVFHGEKTPTMPLPRGGPGYCSATSTLSPSHAESEGSNYFCTGRGPGYCSVDPISLSCSV